MEEPGFGAGREALRGRRLGEGLGIPEASQHAGLRRNEEAWSLARAEGEGLGGRGVRNPATKSQMSRCLAQNILDKTLATEMRGEYLPAQQILPWEEGRGHGGIWNKAG